MTMFKEAAPHVFAMAPGVDFPAALVAGLIARTQGKEPQDMARVTLYLNTQRMRRRVTDLFVEQGAGFLPRIFLISEIDQDMRLAHLPKATPALRRRLELTQLVARLLESQPDLAAKSALFDLSDSLADLLDEMQGEAVTPETIIGLDVSGHSGHWQRTQAFMEIVLPFFNGSEQPDTLQRQRLAVEALAAIWSQTAPQDPVIVAGSTGSRGTTMQFMKLVAGLGNGALVLPGFDFDMHKSVWMKLDNALTAEDHPQFRFAKLMGILGIAPDHVRHWQKIYPPCPARNRLISLALRPAPVTDQWLTEGQRFTDLTAATQDLSLIEAPSQRAEGLAIALALRHAAEMGKVAALITPDRMLTRQVTAALDRWGILPDDSAGRPLALSAPGRFLRHIAKLFGRKISNAAFLTLLKHPLTATGSARGVHLRFSHEYELHMRRFGSALYDPKMLIAWAGTQSDSMAKPWAEWLATTLTGLDQINTRPIETHLSDLILRAEALAAGSLATGSGSLWEKEAGQKAAEVMADLQKAAPFGGILSAYDFEALFASVLNQGQIRIANITNPHIMIWGTLEARVQGADLVILGGLNDGVWPQAPPPDPWLNRQMRQKSGLLLPERRIGLSAHDFQQAICAPQVILSHTLRDAEAPTVPSRWLNRLTNLLAGLPDQGGAAALTLMRARGVAWLDLALRLDLPNEAHLSDAMLQPSKRPSPKPPVESRPKNLPVTAISKLIRDPYHVYARYILKLYRLNPLHMSADTRLRGDVLHKILEQFVKTRPAEELLPQNYAAAKDRLMTLAALMLGKIVPWPAARALWFAQLAHVADVFLESDRGAEILESQTERSGTYDLPELGFTVKARTDRIDVLANGDLQIIDYKTGAPPTKSEQAAFEKQLLLTALIAENGGFTDFGPKSVKSISYIGLGNNPKTERTEITPELLAEELQGLIALITQYNSPSQGYTARRAMFSVQYPSDYDHLSRFGEWDLSEKVNAT
ncbi:MAG: ATP-dependent helicase/nuclease subunit B [Paracoccaceae bacterium]